MHYTLAATVVSTLLALSAITRASLSPQLAETHDYRDVHTYPDSATFDEHDGWKRVVVTDLAYKYPNQSASPAVQTAGIEAHRHRRAAFGGLGRVFERSASKVKNAAKRKRASKSSTKKKVVKAAAKAKASSSGTNVGGLVGSALKGVGKATSVIITWYVVFCFVLRHSHYSWLSHFPCIRYTGNDLKNPSCWAQGSWTPTDESFVCALTLTGWTDRPACLSFLERRLHNIIFLILGPSLFPHLLMFLYSLQ